MIAARKACEGLLAKADIRINGDRPFDIQVHDERLYARVLAQGSLGFGEAYMDGWWDSVAFDETMARLLLAKLDEAVHVSPALLWHFIKARVLNLQSRQRAFEVGEQHYDLGNDLYEAMLDKRMVYTCGYWENAKTLDEAQEAKLDLVCRKIGLKKGERVLDIGCGWGSFAKFAAERYGAEVVGITVSVEQAALARERCQGLPAMPDGRPRVEIRVQDYREVQDTFDHIVSLGMFEHVGEKNYREYFEVARRCLKPGGLFLLHTIGGNRSRHATDPWIHTYIFPNGMIPSVAQIGKAIEGQFVMEDWHNFGPDYDTTLMAWFHNFDAAWPRLRDKYGERFYRMWKYYLLVSAGAFRSRSLQLWQIVLSPDGLPEGYRSIR